MTERRTQAPFTELETHYELKLRTTNTLNNCLSRESKKLIDGLLTDASDILHAHMLEEVTGIDRKKEAVVAAIRSKRRAAKKSGKVSETEDIELIEESPNA